LLRESSNGRLDARALEYNGEVVSPRVHITVHRHGAQNVPARLPLTVWARIRLFCIALGILVLAVSIIVAALIVGSVIAAIVLAIFVILIVFAVLQKKFSRPRAKSSPDR
jgi:membrane protein YdbS with pleckstrin-like domain